jgi:Zn-dependent protease/CBS domain-containing protein
VFGERSIQLVRIAGIRVGASVSWFLFLGIAIWLATGWFETALGEDDSAAFIAAVAAAVLFFGSIVLHELGHAFQARREGIQVEGIDLWIFGGFARLSRDSNTPGEEFRVAIAGPLMNLLIIAVCFGATALLTGADRAVDIATLADRATNSAVELVIGFTATMNFLILVFNLIPAFPLDGGRIARAVVWRITGDRTRGTVVSAWLGQGFGFLLIAWAAYIWFVQGEAGSAIWTGIVGWLIASSARSAAVSAQVSDRLEGITVADIMSTDPVTMPATTRLIDAEDQFFAPHDAPWIAVVDDSGRLLGIAERDRVEQAIDAGQPVLSASEVLTPGNPVSTDQPLQAVIGAESLRRLGAVMAVDRDGVLRGVLTVDQVRRALSAAVS